MPFCAGDMRLGPDGSAIAVGGDAVGLLLP